MRRRTLTGLSVYYLALVVLLVLVGGGVFVERWKTASLATKRAERAEARAGKDREIAETATRENGQLRDTLARTGWPPPPSFMAAPPGFLHIRPRADGAEAATVEIVAGERGTIMFELLDRPSAADLASPPAPKPGPASRVGAWEYVVEPGRDYRYVFDFTRRSGADVLKDLESIADPGVVGALRSAHPAAEAAEVMYVRLRVDLPSPTTGMTTGSMGGAPARVLRLPTPASISSYSHNEFLRSLEEGFRVVPTRFSLPIAGWVFQDSSQVDGGWNVRDDGKLDFLDSGNVADATVWPEPAWILRLWFEPEP